MRGAVHSARLRHERHPRVRQPARLLRGHLPARLVPRDHAVLLREHVVELLLRHAVEAVGNAKRRTMCFGRDALGARGRFGRVAGDGEILAEVDERDAAAVPRRGAVREEQPVRQVVPTAPLRGGGGVPAAGHVADHALDAAPLEVTREPLR